MRKLTPALLGAIGAASLAAAGVAIAQPGDGPRFGAEGPKHPSTRTEAAAKAGEAFARMDANGDGFLDSEDRKARGQERFARLDADGDGSLSAEEFASRPERPRAEMGDRPGKGERMGRKGKRGMRAMHGGRGMMGKMADTDEDGRISQAEFSAAALARFDKVDVDSDGTISADEREQFREARKAERADRRANRRAGQ